MVEACTVGRRQPLLPIPHHPEGRTNIVGTAKLSANAVQPWLQLPPHKHVVQWRKARNWNEYSLVIIILNFQTRETKKEWKWQKTRKQKQSNMSHLTNGSPIVRNTGILFRLTYIIANVLYSRTWYSVARALLRCLNVCNSIMTTSPNGNIFRVTGHLCGEFTSEFRSQMPVTRIFDIFFDFRLNKQLSKQSRHRWFEINRAHYDVTVICVFNLYHAGYFFVDWSNCFQNPPRSLASDLFYKLW